MLKKQDWEEIIYKDGKINEEQVFKELNDYAFLMEQASQVYEHVAGLSKVNTKADEIISEYEERIFNKEITKDDVEDIINDNKSVEDLIEAITGYFEIR